MSTNTIDASMLGKMFLAGARNLEAKKEWINELNVFPVPDGDTGTNMTLTIMSAAAEVGKIEGLTMEKLAKAISSGSLRGARGNSGVILSQLLRGFTKVISEEETLTPAILAAAMEKGVETAYKAVMKPKDGTILTVAKEAAVRASQLAETAEDLQPFLEDILQCAEDVLERTPDMLPVLKEAGVVDSGGQGYVEVLRGALDAFLGKEVAGPVQIPKAQTSPISVERPAQEEEDIRFGYCTEFIVLLEDPIDAEQVEGFKDHLSSIGDSLVVVADEDLVKVHVHTNDPGLALQKGLSFGQLSRIKIDNMREEHREKLFKEAEKAAQAQKEQKEVGFISVSAGEGLKAIFQELGVDYLIEGGQTMNPSTEDMLNAIEDVNADNIFILPNNKNIILAANQAASLIEEKNIFVIPTKTVPQGITALINFMPDSSPEENAARMTEELSSVKTGQVTYAVRDTLIEDKSIRQGDYMGMGDSSILSVGKDMDAVIRELVAQLVDEESAIISIYYGEEIKEETAQQLGSELEETYPDCEVEVHFGGQPIYYYVISVE